jgi:hypothetical protein
MPVNILNILTIRRTAPSILIGTFWLIGFIVAPALFAQSENPGVQSVLAIKPWGSNLIRLPYLFLAYGSFAHYFKQRRIKNLPEPSERVRALLSQSTCVFPTTPFAEAVKIYREETGLDLYEATEGLKAWADQFKRP